MYQNHFLLHHPTAMSLEMVLTKTRLILLEDFLVLLLCLPLSDSSGCSQNLIFSRNLDCSICDWE